MKLNEALFSLGHAARHKMLQQVKQLNPELSPMHLKSLKVISFIEDCTGQKLATFMGRDKAQVNRLIKELVARDLVVKTDNEKDKRSQLLTLSQQGKKIMERFNKIEKQVFESMISGVSQSDIDAFIRIATQLKSNLDSSEVV